MSCIGSIEEVASSDCLSKTSGEDDNGIVGARDDDSDYNGGFNSASLLTIHTTLIKKVQLS